jgi:hypothetical protein
MGAERSGPLCSFTGARTQFESLRREGTFGSAVGFAHPTLGGGVSASEPKERRLRRKTWVFLCSFTEHSLQRKRPQQVRPFQVLERVKGIEPSS